MGNGRKPCRRDKITNPFDHYSAIFSLDNVPVHPDVLEGLTSPLSFTVNHVDGLDDSIDDCVVSGMVMATGQSESIVRQAIARARSDFGGVPADDESIIARAVDLIEMM